MLLQPKQEVYIYIPYDVHNVEKGTKLMNCKKHFLKTGNLNIYPETFNSIRHTANYFTFLLKIVCKDKLF